MTTLTQFYSQLIEKQWEKSSAWGLEIALNEEFLFFFFF